MENPTTLVALGKLSDLPGLSGLQAPPPPWWVGGGWVPADQFSGGQALVILEDFRKMQDKALVIPGDSQALKGTGPNPTRPEKE